MRGSEGIITVARSATPGHLFWRRTMERVDNSNTHLGRMGHIHMIKEGESEPLHFFESTADAEVRFLKKFLLFNGQKRVLCR